MKKKSFANFREVCAHIEKKKAKGTFAEDDYLIWLTANKFHLELVQVLRARRDEDGEDITDEHFEAVETIAQTFYVDAYNFNLETAIYYFSEDLVNGKNGAIKVKEGSDIWNFYHKMRLLNKVA